MLLSQVGQAGVFLDFVGKYFKAKSRKGEHLVKKPHFSKTAGFESENVSKTG